ncbi:MAG: cytochrome c family protein, partial [bacterium]
RGLRRGLPYLLSNDTIGKVFAPRRAARRDGLVIGIYGYLSPGEVYQGSQSDFRLVKVNDALLRRLRSAIRREKHGLALLLFRGGDAELEIFVKSGLFDLIVAGNPSDNELQQITVRKVAGASVPQVPTKGQGVLRIRLTIRPGTGGQARRGAVAPPVQVDWLNDKWPDHAGAAPAFKEYNRQVAASFTAFLKTMESQKRDSPYAGAERCITCHVAAGAAWKKSRHATALKTLEKVSKNFDPECLACHVVGRNSVERDHAGRPKRIGIPGVSPRSNLAPGGFLSKRLTPKLAGVQCENCHGPGRAHAAKPTGKFAVKPGPVPVAQSAPAARTISGPGEFTCRTCHVGSHSPTFDFKVYWPKVKHGK